MAIRLSPYGQLFQMGLYPEIEETYLHIATEGSSPTPAGFLAKFRATYSGTLFLAGGLDLAMAEQLVGDCLIDLPAFGERSLPTRISSRASAMLGPSEGPIAIPSMAATPEDTPTIRSFATRH